MERNWRRELFFSELVLRYKDAPLLHAFDVAQRSHPHPIDVYGGYEIQGIPCIIVFCLLNFQGSVFFYKFKVVATVHQESLSVPYFQ